MPIVTSITVEGTHALESDDVEATFALESDPLGATLALETELIVNYVDR